MEDGKELAIDFKGRARSGPAGEWREAALWAGERFKQDGRLAWLENSLMLRGETPGGWLPGAVQEAAMSAARGMGRAMRKAGDSLSGSKAGWLGVGGAWLGEACATAAGWFKSQGPHMKVRFPSNSLVPVPTGEVGVMDGDVYPGKVGPLELSMVLPADGIKGTGLAFGSFVEERYGKQALWREVCCHELAHAMHAEGGRGRKAVFFGHEPGRASPLDALLASKGLNLGFSQLVAGRFQEAFADVAACMAMAGGDAVELAGWAMEIARDRNKMMHGPGQRSLLDSGLAHDTREALLELARQAPRAAGLDGPGQWKLCMELARKSAAGLMVALADCKERVGGPEASEVAMGMLEAVGGGRSLERAPLQIKLSLSGEEADRAKAVKAMLSQEFGPFAFGLAKRADSSLVKEFGKAREAVLVERAKPRPN